MTDEKNLLDLTNTEVKKYLLQHEQYCTIELPLYFDFDTLLTLIEKELGSSDISNYFTDKKPKSCDEVNYKIYNNKDGNFAWRRLELLNPVLYVDLVNYLTKNEVWQFIVNKFKEFQQNTNIICASIPIYNPNKRKTSVAQQILTWWEKVEQESIIQSLEYEYIFSTDLSDCYGSIYTHSFSWALYGRQYSKEHMSEQNIGYYLDNKIRNMTFGQTNGIPQGSVLMDFLAEIILGYADKKIGEKINSEIADYKIIRYRDDYKIFVHNNADGNKIIKIITEVMSSLGLKLNVSKTLESKDIITDSIKPEKMYYITHFEELYKKDRKETDKKDLKMRLKNQTYLLKLYDYSKKFSNSGQLKKALNEYYENMFIDCEKENVETLISIVFSLAFENPKSFPTCVGIINELLSCLNSNIIEQQKIIKKIETKLQLKPNTEFLEIWLQRMLYKRDLTYLYKSPLCKLVNGSHTEIWNYDWLNTKLVNKINKVSIIDKNELQKMDIKIPIQEINQFADRY